MRHDFLGPARAFGFFTFIAGTNVLGVRLGMAGWPGTTAVLLVLAVLAWVVLGYVVPWTAVLGRSERPVVKDAKRHLVHLVDAVATGLRSERLRREERIAVDFVRFYLPGFDKSEFGQHTA
ncbi:hypothetical protein [Arthrobacter sp. NPDC058192]|uniref:hypothetical protein n=1 Tax=Arthrobacter sp. NPDC058192 TaxID=3346372 RepID=UPI0036F03EF2